MAFTLVYTAEHYVVDILLGWAFAAVAIFALNRYDARRRARAAEHGSPPPGTRSDVPPADYARYDRDRAANTSSATI